MISSGRGGIRRVFVCFPAALISLSRLLSASLILALLSFRSSRSFLARFFWSLQPQFEDLHKLSLCHATLATLHFDNASFNFLFSSGSTCWMDCSASLIVRDFACGFDIFSNSQGTVQSSGLISKRLFSPLRLSLIQTGYLRDNIQWSPVRFTTTNVEKWISDIGVC